MTFLNIFALYIEGSHSHSVSFLKRKLKTIDNASSVRERQREVNVETKLERKRKEEAVKESFRKGDDAEVYKVARRMGGRTRGGRV